MLSTSPPVGPADVAPTSTPSSLSITSLMKPSLPALWIQPRAEAGTWLTAVRTRSPCSSLACASVMPTAADLRIGKGDPRHRVILGRVARTAEQLAEDDAAVIHGHVRERALAHDVAERPHARSSLHPLVNGDEASFLVEADRADAESGQIRRASRRH